jgi:hypothetical protein
MEIHQIKECGRFTPAERAAEYRRRGKSPSGVIGGEYNDEYLEDDGEYNDCDRDWDADARKKSIEENLLFEDEFSYARENPLI